uniref:Uncharacterized protein n=1 Tax=Romanomermis culicivorax TaxID=13658 RepID=A0A915JR36_ROMCU
MDRSSKKLKVEKRRGSQKIKSVSVASNSFNVFSAFVEHCSFSDSTISPLKFWGIGDRPDLGAPLH